MNIQIFWIILDLVELYYSGLPLRHQFSKYLYYSDSYLYYYGLSPLLTAPTGRDS